MGGQPGSAVPTSYYATVQLACDVRVIDDPTETAQILNAQFSHFEPAGSIREPVTAEDRLLSGIRGIELTVTAAQAKFKYAGNKTDTVRARIADRLAECGTTAEQPRPLPPPPQAPLHQLNRAPPHTIIRDHVS